MSPLLSSWRRRVMTATLYYYDQGHLQINSETILFPRWTCLVTGGTVLRQPLHHPGEEKRPRVKITYLTRTNTNEQSEETGLRSQPEHLLKQKHIRPPSPQQTTQQWNGGCTTRNFCCVRLPTGAVSSFLHDAAWNVLSFSNVWLPEAITPFSMPPKIRNSEKDPSCLNNVLDFPDLKYSAPQTLVCLLQWTFAVSKIVIVSHVVVWVLVVLSHNKHITL